MLNNISLLILADLAKVVSYSLYVVNKYKNTKITTKIWRHKCFLMLNQDKFTKKLFFDSNPLARRNIHYGLFCKIFPQLKKNLNIQSSHFSGVRPETLEHEIFMY